MGGSGLGVAKALMGGRLVSAICARDAMSTGCGAAQADRIMTKRKVTDLIKDAGI